MDTEVLQGWIFNTQEYIVHTHPNGIPRWLSGKDSTCQFRRCRRQSLGLEDLLEKGMATHSSILAWRIPWTDEPGSLWSIGLQIIRHDWVTEHTHTLPNSTWTVCKYSYYIIKPFMSFLSGRNKKWWRFKYGILWKQCVYETARGIFKTWSSKCRQPL